MRTTLVSAFPGTGKTHYCKTDLSFLPVTWAVDSDSSTFDKKHFPNNYIEHIKNNIGNVVYQFISSHEDVRKALVDNCLQFTLVYPDISLKDEYIERYKKRGSPEAFINLISNNWEEWITQLIKQEYCNHIVLKKGEFISDVMDLHIDN
tara:strand:- start:214 stop:660 length:447 start_codon:yes stop_codon:yes gene_type:complete